MKSPANSPLHVSTGRDVFEGESASVYRKFPAVTRGKPPVPPPFYTAVAMITQDEIIRRLLMHGTGTGRRIPRGDIYGVGYTKETLLGAPYRDWKLGMWKVGLEGMNRAPAHE